VSFRAPSRLQAGDAVQELDGRWDSPRLARRRSARWRSTRLWPWTVGY